MKQYHDLLKAIIKQGTKKPAARENMPGSTSLFGYQLRHSLKEGFPLLTTKQVSLKMIATELIWFLRGDNNIKYLIDNRANFWNEDAYNFYIRTTHHLQTNTGGISDSALVFSDNGHQTPRNFTFDEFVEIIKTTDRNELPSKLGYTLGDVGYQYGRVWRRWKGIDESKDVSRFRFDADIYFNNMQQYANVFVVDQIANLVEGLKNNPESRRHILTSVDPTHDSPTDVSLYWCHCLVQFNCRPLSYDERLGMYIVESPLRYEQECRDHRQPTMLDFTQHGIPKYALDCSLYQRSADVFLGVPYNIASYSMLTLLLCRMLDFAPGDFIHTFGDVHIYDNHIDQVTEQLSREPRPLPALEVLPNHPDHGSLPDHLEKYLVGRYDLNHFINQLDPYDFRLKDYDPHPSIAAELSTGLVK